MSGFSWHGGTKPRRTVQEDDEADREQSEEPPAEYWEEQAEIAEEAAHE